ATASTTPSDVISPPGRTVRPSHVPDAIATTTPNHVAAAVTTTRSSIRSRPDRPAPVSTTSRTSSAPEGPTVTRGRVSVTTTATLSTACTAPPTTLTSSAATDTSASTADAAPTAPSVALTRPGGSPPSGRNSPAPATTTVHSSNVSRMASASPSAVDEPV